MVSQMRTIVLLPDEHEGDRKYWDNFVTRVVSAIAAEGMAVRFVIGDMAIDTDEYLAGHRTLRRSGREAASLERRPR